MHAYNTLSAMTARRWAGNKTERHNAAERFSAFRRGLAAEVQRRTETLGISQAGGACGGCDHCTPQLWRALLRYRYVDHLASLLQTCGCTGVAHSLLSLAHMHHSQGAEPCRQCRDVWWRSSSHRASRRGRTEVSCQNCAWAHA